MKYLVSIAALSLCVFSGCDSSKSAPPTETAEAQASQNESEETEETAEKEPEAVAESAKSEGKPELPDDMKPGTTDHFGDRFTVIEPPVTLASAIETSGEHPGPYKVEANIEKVCKKKGCWFTLNGEGLDKPVRVRMKDYGFFVPRNADGAKAIVEGTLTSREMPESEAQHYAEDEAGDGEAVEKVEGPQMVYEFTATAIEVRMPAEG